MNISEVMEVFYFCAAQNCSTAKVITEHLNVARETKDYII